jgi:adenylate kinase family enzyme
VVGNSGSGKSTLARELAAVLGVPYLELDSVYHQPGWQPLPADEFSRIVSERSAADGWVIDGNYSAVRPVVWGRADTVVWLDPPRWTVMRQVIWRTLRRAVTREELWNGNREPVRNFFRLDPAESVISWAWHSHAKYRTRYGAAAADPANAELAFIRLVSRRDVARFLADPARYPRVPGPVQRSLRGDQFLRLRDDVDQGAVAHYGDRKRPVDRLFEHEPLQVLGGRHLVAARGEQQVA